MEFSSKSILEIHKLGKIYIYIYIYWIWDFEVPGSWVSCPSLLPSHPKCSRCCHRRYFNGDIEPADYTIVLISMLVTLIDLRFSIVCLALGFIVDFMLRLKMVVIWDFSCEGFSPILSKKEILKRWRLKRNFHQLNQDHFSITHSFPFLTTRCGRFTMGVWFLFFNYPDLLHFCFMHKILSKIWVYGNIYIYVRI